MPALRIVDALNVVEHGGPRLVPASIELARCSFRREAFNMGYLTIMKDVRLPAWERSLIQVWPPHRPFDAASVMPVSHGDPRLLQTAGTKLGRNEQRHVLTLLPKSQDPATLPVTSEGR